jgi:hypothetical protein
MLDKRKNYYLVFDVETAPIDNTIESVEPKNMLVYDLGYMIVDKQGNIYKQESLIIKEIFFNNDLMRSAYYYNKVPLYFDSIINQESEVVDFATAKKRFFKDFYSYGCKACVAYNARFDFYALHVTSQKILGNYFFPYDFEVWDALKMARDIMKQRPTYKRFCEHHNFMTRHKKPQPQMKAETVYRYITNNPNFIESHTGLQDTAIEKEIFTFCLRQHKKMRKRLWG